MLNNLMRAAVLVLLTAVLTTSLTACGFHLRGNIPLSESIKNMFVVAPDGTFKDQLERILTRAGAEPASSESGADVVLVVTDAAVRRTIGTLDERGKANSYNLVFTVKYSLEGADEKNIRPLTTLVESRRYNFNPNQVVEAEAEEAELLESMEEQVSLRIVRQLSTITNDPAN